MIRHIIAKTAFFVKICVLTAPLILLHELLVTSNYGYFMGSVSSTVSLVLWFLWFLFAAFVSSLNWWEILLSWLSRTRSGGETSWRDP